MTRRLIVRPGAERDIAEAADWYDRQRAGLGDEFEAEIKIAISMLADHPQLFACVSTAPRFGGC